MISQKSETFSPLILEPNQLVFYISQDPFALHLKRDGVTYENILAVPAFPLTANEELIHLYQRTEKGEMGELIGIIESIKDLSAENQNAIRQLLKKVCNLPVITKITKILDEFHLFHWFVETDRGNIDFFVGAPRKHITPLPPHALLIKDLQGDMFHIPDRRALDEESKYYLNLVY